MIVAVLVAKQAAKVGVRRFVYVSAADKFPGVPQRYITSKRFPTPQYTQSNSREAETAISQIEGINPAFIRPGTPCLSLCLLGFMFSHHQASQLTPVKLAISTVAGINSHTGYRIPCLGAAGLPPLAVEDVARATISVTLDENITGVVDINAISRLARTPSPYPS
jgi:hypothetical protein